MGKGLSRRQRVGVVLSVLWFIGGGVWGWVLGTHQSDWITDLYSACLNVAYDLSPCVDRCPVVEPQREACWETCSQKEKAEVTRCEREFSERWASQPWWENHLIMVAVVGLLPILLGWLLAWTAIRVTRWVMRGARTT
jgi:hypothetical protein